ncbi:MAG: aminopeptidase N [Gammaproteobacteria bacterium]|nr:aminopeptidase N [Gammaproteobacteria bacterium]
MKDANPNTIYLSEYQQPDYWIEHVDLRFNLGEDETHVESNIQFRRRQNAAPDSALILQGEGLQLQAIRLDGIALTDTQYSVDDQSLSIAELPAEFVLSVETIIKPQLNTSLEGLYQSSGNFCTQCEAEGFRKITYFLDRPDVMATYRTTIIADKTKYPVMLSNGNAVDSGELENNQHWISWQDPFKKPAYLFALVAGDLACIEDSFITQSGREVALKIFVEAHNTDKCDHAMRSLKNAMRWDEEVFGREYDLDIYMIVAVDDFNMGAMENKGLNVFNSKFVLASQDTATDVDYEHIEGVIGHEYFHNWTGNRVTCRDWFQLTLKEGLTVFRDQQFSGDMLSHAAKRIDEVNVLRTRQFAEDAGPMSHPIQPSTYVEINNFYTVTVYNKGAEVIRMLHTLLGTDGFRKGMDLYFQRHDGQAVTTDDFVAAMQDANSSEDNTVDLNQFKRWYHQAGTPVLTVLESYDAEKQQYKLLFKQDCAATAGQEIKEAFVIPVRMGLIAADGQSLALKFDGKTGQGTETVLLITEKEQTFVFEQVAEKPVVSLLRNFSAPVKLAMKQTDEQLAFLMANDVDDFNRWDAGQRLAVNIMLELISKQQAGASLSLAGSLIDACRNILNDAAIDKALAARALTLPSEDYLAEMMEVIDVDAIHVVREFMRAELAGALSAELKTVYQQNQNAEYALTAEAMGQRSLKNVCLTYLMCLPENHQMAVLQYQTASNMTDRMAAFRAICHHPCEQRQSIIEDFYQQWKNDALVLDKWFTVQATAALEYSLEEILQLRTHVDFDLSNPNRVRSLYAAMSQLNAVCFHDLSAKAYQMLADLVIELNQLNPQIAARMLLPLSRWQRYDEKRQNLMKTELKRIAALENIAKDVYEVVSKSLQE